MVNNFLVENKGKKTGNVEKKLKKLSIKAKYNLSESYVEAGIRNRSA